MALRQKKLHELGEVRAGYSFRTALSANPHAATILVQSRDLTDLVLKPESLPKIGHVPSSEQLLKADDVLLSIRGQFKASVFPKADSEAIATASVLKVTLTTQDITPHFLAVFLNSAPAKKFLHERATGGVVNSISISDLRELPIPLLPKERQTKLVEIFDITSRIVTNARRQADLIEQISSYTFTQSVKGAIA